MKFSWLGQRLGFYMAAIGAAFGLGSLWRFPFVAQENGGGAFVFLYFFVLVAIGTPLLISELMIGRATGKSLISALRQLFIQSDQKVKSSVYTIIGLLILSLSLLIIGYYTIISGWVLHYLIHFSTLFFYDISTLTPQLMNNLREHGWLQVLLSSAHLVIVAAIVTKDFDEGVEKFVGFVMPVFVMILVYLLFHISRLESITQSVFWFFYPDFSKLNLNSLSAAVGHACFTLSIGFGAMVTFGAYLNKKAKVPSTGFRVAVMDSLATLFAGLIIFPLLFVSARQSSGPELLFQTVPSFFISTEGGIFLGFLFFFCLYLAALGASLSLIETVVVNFIDLFKIKRSVAAWIVAILCFLISMVPAFYVESKALEKMDHVLVNWFLPIMALGLSYIVIKKISAHQRRDEFIQENDPTGPILYKHWLKLITWIAPFVIGAGLVMQIIALLK